MARDERSEPTTHLLPWRRAYTTPRLQRYGHVSKLTQSGGTTLSEAGNPKMQRAPTPCL